MPRGRKSATKKMEELIDSETSSDTSSDDASVCPDVPTVTQENQFETEDCSSDGSTWQVVKKKEKSVRKNIPKLRRKKKISTPMKCRNNKPLKNEKEMKPDLPDKYANTDQDESDIDESLEYSFNEECTYCKVSDTNCIVQCGNCKKWFCNTTNKNGSHIIAHLARAAHNEVILHRNAFPENVVLKLGCFHCQRQNVFNLGFVTNKADSYNVVLCRIPCGLQQKSGLNGVDLLVLQYTMWLNKSLCDWQPVIKDRYLLPWLAANKTAQLEMQKVPVSRQQINKLEEIWKDDPYAEFCDVDLQKCNATNPQRTKLRYKSAEEFERIFSSLVTLEEDEDEMLNKVQIQDNTTVRWEKVRCKGFIAYVAYFVLENPPGEINLSLNKELRLRYRGGNNPEECWSRVGHIVKTPKFIKDVIGVQFRIIEERTECTTNFIVENVFNSSSYARMRIALEEFALDEETMSEYIHDSILGKKVGSEKLNNDVPKQLSVHGLPKLNMSQKCAIKRALQHSICLIQGPPGTGKTVTSASLVYHLVMQGNGTVLVCAPSNTAVDNLTVKIHATGLNVVRLFAKAREEVESPVLILGLHVLICKMPGWNDIPELVKLHRERQLVGELDPVKEKRYNYLKWPFEEKLLRSADVICCTCAAAGDVRLNGFQFHSILIDECTQATEPECLIPLVRGAQKITFVGDHHQLGPVIKCRPAKEAGLDTSLFERLLLLGNHLVQLEVQYRMHPDLSRFSSNIFYDNLLKNGVNADDHKIQNTKVESLWPKAGSPMLFYSCQKGKDEIAVNGTSYLNQSEAALTQQFIVHLLGCGLRPDQIGIITPYIAQRDFMSQYLEFSSPNLKNFFQEIEIASVDVFQGREKDLIIFSCVRSNDQNNIGFLTDARRLNVAITRARYGLIIIGNPKVLTKNPLWNRLLIHYDKNNALVEGPINHLRKCNVKLNKPSGNANFIKKKTFSAKEYFHD